MIVCVGRICCMNKKNVQFNFFIELLFIKIIVVVERLGGIALA